MEDYKKLINEIKSKDSDSMKEIKIAILNSYTINNISDPLTYLLLKDGFNPDIKFGGYNQFIQELIDPFSWLHSFKPDIIFLALSTRTYFKDIEFEILDKDKDTLNKIVDEKFGFIKNTLVNLSLPSKVIVTNLEHPVYSPYGLMDLTMENGMHAIIDRFNENLIRLSKENPNVSILDYEKFCSKFGKLNIFDEKMFYLGKILLTNASAAHLAHDIVKIINAAYGNIKKCLIVDADNTLWGGIIGEDGIERIEIGDTNIGSIYLEIQKILLNYKKAGILLGLVSKNNHQDVTNAFNENKNMILKESDFVVTKINWEDKSKNIQEIAKEINLGLDSFVFLDDSPLERLEVKSRLPMVEVIEFPEDISLLPKILKELHYFNMLNLTEEDKKRSEMYQKEKLRTQLKKEYSLEEYLHKLETKISIKKDDISSLERITQLINKTNQFNLRTQRYTLEQVKMMIESKDYAVLSLSVKDKFGELGLTGIAVVRIGKDYHFIENFLMSCRILSRKIEHQFFTELIKSIKKIDDGLGVKEIRAEYIPTLKNEMVKNFYEEFGFKIINESDGKKVYSKLLKEFEFKEIGWITLEKNEE